MKCMDFVLLVYGLSTVLLAVMAWRKGRAVDGGPDWRWLAGFGLFNGVSSWQDMLAISLGDGPVFQGVRLGLMALSFLALVEFGRSGLAAGGVRVPGRWVFLPLTAFAILGVLDGLHGLDAACRLSLALPGALLAGWVLLRQGRRPRAPGRSGMVLAAVAMFLYAPACGLIVPQSPFFPASMLNEQAFVGVIGVPIQAVRMLCAVLAAMGLWFVQTRLSLAKEPPGRADRCWVAPAAIAAVLIAGWAAANESGRATNTVMRNRLLSQVRSIAATVDAESVKDLAFTSADRSNVSFERIRSQMIAYGRAIQHEQANGHFLGIYSMIRRNGKLLFGPENIDVDDSRASPPGTAYEQPPVELLNAFDSGRAVTNGPYTDEYGTFVSGFAPVFDNRSSQVVLVVGMDIMANEWEREIALARLGPILFSLVLSTLLPSGIAALRWRARLGESRRRWLRHAEALLMASVGLVISAAVACLIYVSDSGVRRSIFEQVADAQAARTRNLMRDIQDFHLAGLARIIEGNPNLSRQEFRSYAMPLTRSSAIEGYAWIPRVEADLKDRFETDVRDQGRGDFMVFQKNDQGATSPATGRGEYYPVLYVEPLGENKSAVGYDLGSDHVRRTALDLAARTGLPTASDPITLVNETERQKGLLVYRPVFGQRGTNPGAGEEPPLRGFATAVIRLESLLRQTQKGSQSAVAVDMFECLPDADPLLLASTNTDRAPNDETAKPPARADLSDWAATYPVFAFGKVFALVIRPTTGFRAVDPIQAAALAGAVGLLLTLLMATLVGFMSHRRASLEQDVMARTAALDESRQYLQTIFDTVGAGIVLIDPLTHHVMDMNGAAETLVGRPKSEVLGRLCHQFICPAEQGKCPVTELGQSIDCSERVLLDASGRRIPITKSVASVMANGRPCLLETFFDISAQKSAQQAAEQANARLLHAIADSERLAKEAKKASAAKSEFLANMSHEIRTPLNGVVGMLDLLAGTPVTDQQGRYVGTARRSADMLLTVINDILDFSKIEAGKLNLESVGFDLQKLAEDIGQVLAADARGKEVELIVQYAPQTPRWLTGDPARVRQILTNLVGNAVKFTTNGHVLICVTCDGVDQAGANIHVRVQDTGIGIEPDKLAYVFDKFT